MFLCAIKLNLDEVNTRCSTCKTKTVEHIFAGDIVIHKNCMKGTSCNIKEMLKKLSIMMNQMMIQTFMLKSFQDNVMSASDRYKRLCNICMS